jgi:hypothetical protein
MPGRIVAVGLLTEEDLSLLGSTFTRLWPVDGAPQFDELLAAIDEAERQLGDAKVAPDGYGPSVD